MKESKKEASFMYCNKSNIQGTKSSPYHNSWACNSKFHVFDPPQIPKQSIKGDEIQKNKLCPFENQYSGHLLVQACWDIKSHIGQLRLYITGEANCQLVLSLMLQYGISAYTILCRPNSPHVLIQACWDIKSHIGQLCMLLHSLPIGFELDASIRHVNLTSRPNYQ